MVSNIMYAMVFSRPYLIYSINLVGKFISNLEKPHRHDIKNVLQYLFGTQSLGLQFGNNVHEGLYNEIKEAIWLKGISHELGLYNEIIIVYYNNQSIIHLVKNQVYHNRSKHIDIILYFVREIISTREIKLENISTEENPFDMLIKAWPTIKFKYCLNLINMRYC